MAKIGMTLTGGREVRSTYSDEFAELRIRVIGHGKDVKVVLDETDCDNLLRVREYSQQPHFDISEFLSEVEGLEDRIANAVADHFVQCAAEIAKHVYVD